MATTPFDAWERELLRHEAVVNWHQAEELMHLRNGPTGESELAPWIATLADSPTRFAFAANVDWAIASWTSRSREFEEIDGAVALVASAEHDELLRIQELLSDQCVRIVLAGDVGSVLGLAIAVQPDIAVVDAELELGSGVDAALTLLHYAPHTKVLVLTDDTERAEDIRIVGLEAAHRHVPDTTLLAWVRERVA